MGQGAKFNHEKSLCLVGAYCIRPLYPSIESMKNRYVL